MRTLNAQLFWPLMLVFLHAEASHAEQKVEQKNGPWNWGIQGGVVHQFDTDMSDTDGNFSLDRYLFQSSVGYAWDRRTSVSLSLGLGEYDYDFSSQANINGEEPWDTVREYRVSVPIRFKSSKNTNVVLIPGIVSRAEKGASIGDGRSERLLAGISWTLSDTLTIGPGFGWSNTLGGGSSLFPIILLDWSITENLSLTTGSAAAASSGPGLSLNYDLSKDWQVSVAVRKEKTRFVLDDKGAIPDGFGKDENIPVHVSLQYMVWKKTEVSAFVSSKFEGEVLLEDSQRNNIARSDYDVAYAIGLTFKNRF
tara:strand:- start:947 stop:1873 length:927 start_codon:yes stop_codon:yes gene_type:complete